MRYLVFLLLFSVVACGEDPRAQRATYSAYNQFGSFQPYLRGFDKHYVKYKGKYLPLGNLEISFVDDIEHNENAVGVCNYESRKIRIDRTYWNTIGEDARTVLIYHELGHCYLNRGHTTTKTGAMPNSIMYPDLSPANYFAAHREEYIEELFTKNINLIKRAAENYRYDAGTEESVEHHPFKCSHKH